MTNVSSGFIRAGANANKDWAANLPIASASVNVNAQPVTSLPPLAETLTQAEVARTQGYTGNQCSNCFGMHMQIAGHCEVCSDCGTTTGCS